MRENNDQVKEMEYFTSTEILEAACNESIPGLTGVSNFTVFLYCKLFQGENSSSNPTEAQLGLDLHSTCSDAAWYLSAAEEDFLWVHVCSEFFAHEFNNTVCANSSFWLQRAHQVAGTKNYHLFNQTNIDDLCVHLSGEAMGSLGLNENCLAQLGGRSLSARAFRHCFLPNSSVLISALCGKDSPDSHPSLSEGSWAAAYCSKILNVSRVDTAESTCQYLEWDLHHFTNTSLLELCAQTHGLREHICLNATLYRQLLRLVPQFADVCADLQAELESRKCLLQRFFDMLPAPYELDTSQLCVDPAPLLADFLHKLSVCEVEGGEREGFLVGLGYVLRVLDFMVGLSAGLDEGEREARQGLGQAILLSSLLDNTSWATLQPEACISILHTEYLQMPRDSIRTIVMSAKKDAVKRFISHMHQSWNQLQVETSQASQKELQAMETMTAAFIHKFPRVTPELFVDLSQFIPFMSVSDIMNFPASLIVNDSVLTAIRDHSSGMKSLQKKAFVKRLLQASVVGDVPTWPPYFLISIFPLLPYLPVSHFQQLTSQQLAPLVELLGNSSLDGVRGRHVLRTLFSKKKNLTSDDILRLGVLACYLDPVDLGFYLQDSAVSSAVWQQLALCMSKGFISPSGRLSSWLVPAVQALNVSSMSLPELSALRGLLPELGASFVLHLPSSQLLEVLSQPGLHRYPPAQLTMEELCSLKSLHSGLSPAVLRDLQWPEINETVRCQCWRMLLTELKPGQKAMMYDAMQEAQFLFKTIHEFRNITSKSLRVTMIEKLTNASFRAILDHIQAHFTDFLRLPHYKQNNLAEMAVAELGSSQAKEEIDGTMLDVLGPLLPFLDRDSLALVDRRALALRLEEIRSFCLPKEALRDISALLTQKDLFGEPSKWQAGDIEHLGRLVFSLSTKQINAIPLTVLNKDTVEQVLVGQWHWEDSVVGAVCMTQCMDQHHQRQQTQNLIRGIVKARSRRAKMPVPSCADIRGTFPSAWTPTQLSRMLLEDLKQCVEVFGQDALLSPEQRRALWLKLRQSFSPVRELRADRVLALGSVVTEMGERELQEADFSDLGVLAHLGTLTAWSPKKMRAVILGVMLKRKQKVEQLTVVDLATFGHLICGLYPSEIKRLSPYNLSMAVLFLREMSLPCTEQQMEALTSRLFRPEAFGPVSAWGPEVFTEIGTLAAGLEDMVLSALVQEQMEGITPEALSLMSPKKMAVVFSAVQLSCLSPEQAWAVTKEQWGELDTSQRHAVELARYEGDVVLEQRDHCPEVNFYTAPPQPPNRVIWLNESRRLQRGLRAADGDVAALQLGKEGCSTVSTLSTAVTYFLGLVRTTQRYTGGFFGPFTVPSSVLAPRCETTTTLGRPGCKGKLTYLSRGGLVIAAPSTDTHRGLLSRIEPVSHFKLQIIKDNHDKGVELLACSYMHPNEDISGLDCNEIERLHQQLEVRVTKKWMYAIWQQVTQIICAKKILPEISVTSAESALPWTAPTCRRNCAALEPMASGPPSPSVGHRLRHLELLLGPLLVLLVSGIGSTVGEKVYTNTWAVHIPGGQEEADLIASKYGFINYGHMFVKLNTWMSSIEDGAHRLYSVCMVILLTEDAHTLFGSLLNVIVSTVTGDETPDLLISAFPQGVLLYSKRSSAEGVTWAQQQVSKRRKKRDVFEEPLDPKFGDQWYLYNSNHRDLNATAAWQLGYTGKGVVVSILDDGIEKNHPDLIENYDPDASYDVNDGDPDPQPRYTQLNENRHGTRCAGEVAAVANNGICGVGVAYNAKIGGTVQ
ncbi:Stereocilin Precursor [Channa argus]|uniref:Stereocilin n=1 Tax=Channa argus TaxID=215402 RepID=A0A6G1P8D3_CHAAH|nr:Stereocilin Precursor [Channa argus]